MKRDMDLVRKILLAVEETDSFPDVPGYSSDEIARHIEIMTEYGLVDATIERAYGSSVPICVVRGLTWEGHEFLDAARNEFSWNQAKKRVLETTGQLGLEALKAYLFQ